MVELMTLMTMTLGSLEKVPLALRDHVASYARLVRELAGEAAKSLVLYGDVLSGEFDSRRAAILSILVVQRIDLQLLHRLGEHGARLGGWGIAAPLVLTPEHISGSLDSFPLELMEIAQCHLAVFGEDSFRELTFADSDVRLQCEREIKRLLIGLRQGLLATAGRDRLIPALEHDAAESLARTLRGILWLRGKREHLSFAQMVAEMERVAGRGLSGVRAALDRASRPGWPEFQQLYHDAEALGELVRA